MVDVAEEMVEVGEWMMREMVKEEGTNVVATDRKAEKEVEVVAAKMRSPNGGSSLIHARSNWR